MPKIGRRQATVLLSIAVLLAASGARAGGPASFPTHHDDIPNFARNETIQSVTNGAWSNPGTWAPARVPLPSDVVHVLHTVTYDSSTGDADVIGIDAGAALRFATGQNTRLRVGVLLIMPGGTLEVGTAASPLPAPFTAEIVIKNRPLDAVADPEQYGTGLLSVDGTVRMHGSVKSPTFVRLALAPSAGANTFSLADPVSGWRVGDKLVLPDSVQKRTENTGVPHSYDQEEVVVQALSPDGRTITFAPALAFNHPGTTDEDADGRPDYLPHVANLARNVVVRSETRTGTRGHVLLTNRAHVDIRYAAFVDLGRTTFNDLHPVTNHIGRYSLHAHHLLGAFPTVDPEYQFRLVGNAVREDSPTTPPQKWGIAIHGSHYGLIQQNVVYNVGGAGIVTEDGSESFDVFDRNFVARVFGNGGRNEVDESGRGVAREGVGFWFRGTNNDVRGNVAANMIEGPAEVEAAYGFKYNMTYLGDVRIPNFRGASPHVAGQYTTVNGNAIPILRFQDNETYGQIQGLTLWWLCSEDFTPVPGCGQSVLRNMVIWHTARYAYYGYPGYNYTFDGLKVYGDPVIAGGNNHEFKSVFWFGDYGTTDLLVTNASFFNTIGLNPPYFRDGSIRVENSFFKTRGGILHRKSGAEGSCPQCDLPDPDTIVTGNRFVPVAGQPLRSVSLDDSTTDPENNDRLFVCNHQGQLGDNFEVFFPTQGNAPCTATRPDVEGYVCVTPLVASRCSAAPQPSLTLGDAIVTEGDGGTTSAAFAARLSASSAQPVTAAFATANGTATAGSDYQAASGTLTFPPGSVAQTLSVNILGDTAVEADETFRLDLSNAAGATLADGQGDAVILDDDAPSMSTLELTHGSRLSADLAGGTPDFYRIGQAAHSSYEATLDAVSGDLGPGLRLERLAADNATVLQTAAPTGTGTSLALRWENTLGAPVVSQHLRIAGASCGTACGPDDVYRLRVYETTGAIPRFNNSGTQVTVLLLQNTTGQPVNARARFWSPAGALLLTHPVTLPPRSSHALNTAALAGLQGQGGSVTVAHDGPYGALTGKAVALEVATGFSFDSTLTTRPR